MPVSVSVYEFMCVGDRGKGREQKKERGRERDLMKNLDYNNVPQ